MAAGRPTTDVGTWGAVKTMQVRPGVFRSRTRIRDRDGIPREVTATGTTKSAAERSLRGKLVDRLPPSRQAISASTTMATLAETWIAFLRSEGRIEDTTINEYERVLSNTVLPELGGLRLREATTSRPDGFIVGVRPKSANRQRKAKVVLGAMLDMAVRHDALVINPVRQTARVARPKTEPKALSVGDLRMVREAVHAWMTRGRPGPRVSSDMADIVDLMLATGARIGEILALRWSDVDLDGERPSLTISGTIKTEPGRGTYRKASPKSDASRRTIVLPPFAVAMLHRRLQSRLPTVDPVFPTRNGTWHQVTNIERRWRRIRKDTGLEWVTPHVFRKTVATLISEQVDSETASQQLGHSSSPITREFYIVKPVIAADVADVLQQLSGDAES